jgi:hypothetical protein
MNDQKKLEVAEISNELWGDNLWYRPLDQESKDAVALTVWMMRNLPSIKGPVKFSTVFKNEIDKMLKVWKSRNF